MKALTIRQPWASLVIMGEKNVENRSFQISYRGPLAIHAGLAIAPWQDEHMAVAMAELGLCSAIDLKTAPRGVVLGTVDLVDVLMNHDSIWTMDTPFQWIFENAQRFDIPAPAKGSLGIWNWNPDE